MNYQMLIVEDDELTSMTVEALFKNKGFEIKRINNGSEVLPWLLENHADIVILDLELPGKNGDQIYHEMKLNPGLRNIPVVPFTAMRNKPGPSGELPGQLAVYYFGAERQPVEIVHKVDEQGGPKDTNEELFDQVWIKLVESNKQITSEMLKHYQKRHGLSDEELMKKFNIKIER